MYGFIGSISLHSDKKVSLYCEPHKGNPKLIQNETSWGEFQVKRLTLDKFANDKVFYESEDTVIVAEGVIYNFLRLEEKYGIKNRGVLLEKMFKELSLTDFADQLNGMFALVIYDKKAEKLNLIGDAISYKSIWYVQSNDCLLFSTDIDWLYRTFSQYESLKVDYNGLYCLLNYGYMLGDVTPVKGIKKVLAGNVLEYLNGEIAVHNYYSIPCADTASENVSKNQIDMYLESIDSAFENGVAEVYQKDDEYGYKHCMTLSGGMDSRAILFMAKRLGYETTCLTMGESNCADIKISSKICHNLGEEHIIYELDNGNFMSNMDSAIEATGATIVYPGFAHIHRFMSFINFENYGAVHSGDVGGLILGGTFLTKTDNYMMLPSIRYGSEFLDRFSDEFKQRESKRYPDLLRFGFYNRQLNSSCNGYYATSFFTECSFPFITKELLNIAFSIPQYLIQDHKIYSLYMKEYLPGSCDYIWEHTGCRPGEGKFKRYIVKWKQRIQSRIFKRSISMNPFEKWYQENPDIKTYFDHIFQDAEIIKNDNPVLYEDLVKRFASSRVMDKSLACEVVAFIKKYNVKL